MNAMWILCDALKGNCVKYRSTEMCCTRSLKHNMIIDLIWSGVTGYVVQLCIV